MRIGGEVARAVAFDIGCVNPDSSHYLHKESGTQCSRSAKQEQRPAPTHQPHGHFQRAAPVYSDTRWILLHPVLEKSGKNSGVVFIACTSIRLSKIQHPL